jgi:hypothetical protein
MFYEPLNKNAFLHVVLHLKNILFNKISASQTIIEMFIWPSWFTIFIYFVGLLSTSSNNPFKVFPAESSPFRSSFQENGCKIWIWQYLEYEPVWQSEVQAFKEHIKKLYFFCLVWFFFLVWPFKPSLFKSSRHQKKLIVCCNALFPYFFSFYSPLCHLHLITHLPFQYLLISRRPNAQFEGFCMTDLPVAPFVAYVILSNFIYY